MTMMEEIVLMQKVLQQMQLVENTVSECAEPQGNGHNSVTLQVPQKQS